MLQHTPLKLPSFRPVTKSCCDYGTLKRVIIVHLNYFVITSRTVAFDSIKNIVGAQVCYNPSNDFSLSFNSNRDTEIGNTIYKITCPIYWVNYPPNPRCPRPRSSLFAKNSVVRSVFPNELNNCLLYTSPSPRD